MNTELIRQRIREHYEDFTPTERRVADYLLFFRDSELPSTTQISQELFVSEATMTRFAKRCGFHGFREMRFSFFDSPRLSDAPLPDPAASRIENSYQYLMERTISSVDEQAVRRVTGYLQKADTVLVCGIGYSGISAMEYQLRLLRIGLRVEAANESHLLRIMASLLSENSVMIALSVGGSTKEIVQALKIARGKRAKIVLVTSSQKPDGAEYCDEILHTGSIRDLNSGITVSPQLPLLFVLDLLYAQLLSDNFTTAMSAHSATLSALGIRSLPDQAKHHRKDGSES